MKNSIPFYRQHTFMTAVLVLSFFIPFLFLLPLAILLSGEVYERMWTDNEGTKLVYKPWSTAAKKIFVVLLSIIGLFWLSSFFGDHLAKLTFKLYSYFFNGIFALAFSAAVIWQFKKPNLILKIFIFIVFFIFFTLLSERRY